MVGKKFMGFRFDPLLYERFGEIADAGGFTVTGALERFMVGCIEKLHQSRTCNIRQRVKL